MPIEINRIEGKNTKERVRSVLEYLDGDPATVSRVAELAERCEGRVREELTLLYKRELVERAPLPTADRGRPFVYRWKNAD